MMPMATLNNFASQVAGSPVQIVCEDPRTFTGGTLAFVISIDGQVVHTIHLPRPTCVNLMHLNEPSPHVDGAALLGGKIADLDNGQDVLAFEHEAMHIALNSQDEGCVEATAIANVWQFVRLFKLPAWKVDQIMRGAQIAHSYSSPEYLTGCR